MKIGFVIADENEYYPFLDFARENGAKESIRRSKESVEFSQAGKDIVAVKCGIGTVNGAAAAAFLIADDKNVTNASLSWLRNTMGKELGLCDPNRFEFAWITDWPSFEWNEEEGRYIAAHHPFTSPKNYCKDLLLTNPEHCYSKCYDVVLNGYELGSGSIRIHEQKVQGILPGHEDETGHRCGPVPQGQAPASGRGHQRSRPHGPGRDPGRLQ